MPREADSFWRYVEVVENNKRRCIFCRNECAGGATRIKAHLAVLPGYGIKGCERVDDHVREEALKAIKGKSVSDPSRVGGTSGERRETRSGGVSQTLFPCNYSPHSNDGLNSNQHTWVSQQPSGHWQTGSDAAAVHPQHHPVLPPFDVSLDDLDISWQSNQSHQSFDAEHGDEISLSLQQSSMGWLASLSPDSNNLPQLFDQSVSLDIGSRQQYPRASSSLQIDLFLSNSASNVLHESTRPTGSSKVTTAGNPEHSNQPYPNFDEQHIGESISHSPMFSAEGIPYLLDLPYQPQSSIPSPYPKEMQMNDRQTPTGASSSQYDQLLDIGNSNLLQDCNQQRISSVTSLGNIVPHSNEPLPSCNEECGTETSLFPPKDSVGIYPLIELQSTGGPHIFKATNVYLQVLEGGANMAAPSSSQVRPASVPPHHQSVPYQSTGHETRNAEQNSTVPSSSCKNHLVICLPPALMDMDPCIVSSSQAPNNAPPPPQIPPCGTGLIGPSTLPDMNKGAPMTSHPNTGNKFEENGVLKRKLKRLYSREADIRGELEFAASLSLKKPRMEVENWLADVGKLRNDFLCIEAASEDCLPPHQQLDILMREVEDLMRQGKFPKGPFEARETKVSKLLEGKMVGEAFQRNTTKILEHLVGNQLSRLGIYGMGGVGKATIMVHIHNRLLEKENYHNVLWITVSQDFNTQKLQDDIWEALGLGKLQEKDVRKRAAMLFDCFTKRGKSIIILDDVWECVDLEEVGIPVRVDGIKLVLTTRSFDVCCQMHCQEKIKIEPLSQKEAESLFMEELGSEVALNLETEAVVKSIVKECAGLPLGVIMMARSMRGVTDVFEWKDSSVKLKESDMGQTDKEKVVVMNLKFSYDRLGNHEVQQCFLSCALYPEDQCIDNFELIEFFLDQGLIGGLNTREKQYDRSLTILNKLKNVCLLEDHGSKMKKHNLIRDMALHIMSATSIIKAGKGLMRIPLEEYWTDALEKVSLMENDIREFPLNRSSNCPNLSTFLLNRSLFGDVVIPDSFFKQLQGLKVLNLSGCELRELPDSISDLVNLRALLLRMCRKLRRIPYLGKLKSLRKLDASGCVCLEALVGLEMLVNLRYLDLTNTLIRRLPKGILGVSLNLQYLKVKVLNGEDVTKMWALETLECYFEDVDGFNKCARVIKQINPHYDKDEEIINIHDSPAPTPTPLLFRSLRFLNIFNCPKLKYLVFGHGSKLYLPRLRKIDIGSCEEMVGIAAEVTSSPPHQPPAFPSLELISVWMCHKMKRVVESEWLSHFPNLRDIEVFPCKNMEEIVGGPPYLLVEEIALESLLENLCSNMRRLLPHELLSHLRNLGRIKVCSCKGMVEMISRAGQGQEGSIMTPVNNTPSSFWPSISLPKLKRLVLYDLPQLKSICEVTVSCDSMRYIVVYKCAELNKIPLQL